MIFPTIEFCIFFVVVLATSWALMQRPAPWKLFLLAASYLFYGSADWRFAFLLAAVSLGNQFFATLITSTDDEQRKTNLLKIAVTLNLLQLGIFKYYGFFIEDIGGVLDSIGLGMPLPLITVALPVGVSFFTFQAISYVVDVRRGDVARGSTVDVLLYISFFPQLVAGPIVRAQEFLPQLQMPRDPRNVRVGAGILLIITGVVKKVILADYLARELVDPVYSVPEAYSSPDILLATWGFAAQVYCDFSGYTDIAIGLALLMGLTFPRNFDKPFRSASVQEFWRRWHMTLSRFLRDYLYIALGGNRRGQLIASRNLFLTMLLGGLWHGAAFGFVLWGAMQGAWLAIERELRLRQSWRPPTWLAVALAINFFAFSLIPFRAASLDISWAFFQQFADPGPATLWTPTIVLMVAVIVVSHWLPERPVEAMRARVEALPVPALSAALAVTIMIAAATIPSQGVPPFVYFQF